MDLGGFISVSSNIAKIMCLSNGGESFVFFSRKSPQTRPDQGSAVQCSAVHNQRWGEIYVLGFYSCGWRVLVLCLERREGGGVGVSVGCRVFGRVRWWKWRKGFGEWGWGWECGGSGGGFVASSRRFVDP